VGSRNTGKRGEKDLKKKIDSREGNRENSSAYFFLGKEKMSAAKVKGVNRFSSR